MASAMMHFYETMHPRRSSDPAAHPPSAKKVIESIRRTHLVRMSIVPFLYSKSAPGGGAIPRLAYRKANRFVAVTVGPAVDLPSQAL